jgi:hypothetical protein
VSGESSVNRLGRIGTIVASVRNEDFRHRTTQRITPASGPGSQQLVAPGGSCVSRIVELRFGLAAPPFSVIQCSKGYNLPVVSR